MKRSKNGLYMNEISIKRLRKMASLSLSEAAALFGMGYESWQRKESTGKSTRRLSAGELHFLQLLANSHQEYLLIPRTPDEGNKQQKVANCALQLGQYLANGNHHTIVLQSEFRARLAELNGLAEAALDEWVNSLNQSVGNALPQDDEYPSKGA